MVAECVKCRRFNHILSELSVKSRITFFLARWIDNEFMVNWQTELLEPQSVCNTGLKWCSRPYQSDSNEGYSAQYKSSIIMGCLRSVQYDYMRCQD